MSGTLEKRANSRDIPPGSPGELEKLRGSTVQRKALLRILSLTMFLSLLWSSGFAQSVSLLPTVPDPYGCPRPYFGETSVPLRTSYYIQLKASDPTDRVLPEGTTMALKSAGLPTIEVLRANREFQPGYSGTFATGTTNEAIPKKTLILNIDSSVTLAPLRDYTAYVAARSEKGGKIGKDGYTSWTFRTEAATDTHTLSLSLDVNATSVTWEGGFFTGFVKPSFCTTDVWGQRPSYDLMRKVQQDWSPKAWSLQRDWWITGFEYQAPPLISGKQPNIVRELETRRITTMTAAGANASLSLEDFFGHEQYGLPSGRKVSADYHPGDIVLVADGIGSSTGTVMAVNDATSSVLVNGLTTPAGGWAIDYPLPLPTQEEAAAPGLFPWGGCYLRKFSPTGTAHYYWGRSDYELDIVHREYGRRLVVNFCDGPGDLSIDGGSFTTCKDYAQMHEAAYKIADHLIDRYGTASLNFYWEIGNENDHQGTFWRVKSWTEFLKYYDYTSDGILRAFEDNGFDSNKVIMGGLAFGRIKTGQGDIGYHIFLAHASPSATYDHPEARELNFAYADERLDGKRSARVEALCSANGGKGAPFDFVDPHFYMSSYNTATHMIWTKAEALKMDPVYFANLAVGTNESCPNWAPPPDQAAEDSYLGNGYFGTWMTDVVRRLLNQAGADARYRFGESTLTFWPWPPANFKGRNGVTQVMSVDDDGDWKTDRQVTVGLPELYLAGMIGSMGSGFWSFPERKFSGHWVSGFAARTEKDVRILLYSHHEFDTQSRSDRAFDVQTTITGLNWPKAHITEYRLDKTHNSLYSLGRELTGRPNIWPQAAKEVEEASAVKPTLRSLRTPVDGKFVIPATVAGNGINFIILSPNPGPTRSEGSWRGYN